MKNNEVKKMWAKNFRAWKRASEQGFDVWRDYLNTPAFLKMLPDVSAKIGLDIGSGEGHNSKLIAQRCGKLIGIDICEELINDNNKLQKPDNLIFQAADASALPFSDGYFDFVVATMSFMDIPNIEKVLYEIFRVLKIGGFLQFSITHPCFNEFKGEWVKDKHGDRFAFMMKDYFTEIKGDIHQWKHFYSPTDEEFFETPRFFKSLAHWLNALIKVGFSIEELAEPYADDESIKKYPVLSSTRIVAHSLIVRVKK